MPQSIPNQVRKAVLPVAGFGTRLLPASKSIPKEMMTVVDRPAIDYVVQEAIAAGIDTIILISNSGKQSIEKYFSRHAELEALLQKNNKISLLEQIRNIIPQHISIITVYQSQPLGLGHAVLCAQPVVGHEPFAVLLPDVLVDGCRDQPNDLHVMLQRFEQTGTSQIMVENVAPELVNQYGIVSLQQSDQAIQTLKMTGIVEKPALDQTPSTLAVVGRYIFTPQIFDYLEKTQPDRSGEIQLTDAIAQLLTQQSIEAYPLQGQTFDCGSKRGYLKAVLHYASQRPEFKDIFED